jgi:putative DNA primase/helicase
MTAAEIAKVLGAAQRSGRWWRCVCPVHGSRTGTSATLALREGSRGLIVVCHAGCSRADVLAELRRRGWLDNGDPAPAAPEPGDNRERRIAIARHVWGMGREARGTAVARYLAARGITIPPPSRLRWAPTAKLAWALGKGYAPAMLARIDGPDGELIGVHRTYLHRDEAGTWHRHARAMLGCAKGGAVRLGAIRAADWLVIAEGIETTLSVMQACRLPGWAALSAMGLEHLILPPEAKLVAIAADNDPIGRRAAMTAAARWHREGRRVRILAPSQPGADWNDILMVAHG